MQIAINDDKHQTSLLLANNVKPTGMDILKCTKLELSTNLLGNPADAVNVYANNRISFST